MNVRRVIFSILFSLGISNVCFAQADKKFTGRIVLLSGNPKEIENLSVRLIDIGPGITGTDGKFSIAIKKDAATVTLQLMKSDLTILYPSGGVAKVPADPNEVVAFIVGDSPKDMLTKAVAKSNNEIKTSLSQLGVKQDNIEQTLLAFRDEMQKITNVKLDDLKEQIDIDSKRRDFYPKLSASINDFINEAKDIRDAFKFTARHAFDDQEALNVLIDAIKNYNVAYEEINRQHSGYEKIVLDLWESEPKASETREFFNYALGELHSSNIFTLNQKISEINEYNRGNLKASKKKEMKDMILHDIDTQELQLDRRLQELDNRAQVLLSRLAM